MSLTLNIDTINLHPETFVYTYNPNTNEIISGSSDCLLKFLPITESTAREIIDETTEITSLCLLNNTLYYNQANNLQMVKLNDNGDFTSSTSSYVSSIGGSKITSIEPNYKYNLIICTNEDDDIQVINTSNMKVYQYKTITGVSLKYIKCSSDGNYLITVGCDGVMIIYSFDSSEQGKIVMQSKINSVFKKTTLENKQQTNMIDVNDSNNIVIVSGDILLRYFTIDSNNNTQNTEIQVMQEKNIFHNANINIVKWILNTSMLLTCDINNVIKIWDFASKTLIYEYKAIELENNEIINNITVIKMNDDSIKIAFGDSNGNIHFSDEIALAKHNKEKNHNEDDISMKDNELNSNDNGEKMFNLSDIEDEEGNIRNKEQIEQKYVDNKANEPEFNLNTIKEQLRITDTQEPFIPSSTLGDGKSSRYLCYNLTGKIISRNDSSFKAIDIVFSDNTNKKNVSFIDTNEYYIATLNSVGALFANRIEEENLDEYEKEDKQKNAFIEFKTIQVSSLNFTKDWIYKLPSDENPILLCIGSDWCCVYTSMSYLRIISIFGVERQTLSVNGNVIAIAGYENYLAYVYHGSVSFNNSQQLRVRILDSNDMFNQVYEGELAITPESNLIWFGFSEEGILITYDSFNILRGLFINVNTNWIPLLDLGEVYSGTNINYWVIGVDDGEVYGIEMKDDVIEPQVDGNTTQKVFQLMKENNSEWMLNDYRTQYYMIVFSEKRYLKYRDVKGIREEKFPEFCFTELLKGENELKKMKKDFDKKALSDINNYIIKGEHNKAVVLFELLFLKKSKDIVIHMCNEYMQHDLSKYLMYKTNLCNIMNEMKNEKNVVMKYNNDHIMNSTIRKEEHDERNKNALEDIAIDLASYRDMEQSIKNDLFNKGVIKKESDNDVHIKEEIVIKKEDDNEGGNNVISNSNNVNLFYKQTQSSLSNTHDLFSDLSKLNVDNVSNSNLNNNNNNLQRSGNKVAMKRKHKELLNASLPFGIPSKDTKKQKK